jgi:DNA-binding NarL/FixJ family response regulator
VIRENPVKVAIVEDEALLRSLLASTLSSQPTIEVLETYADAATAGSGIPVLAPDVITLDISLGPGPSGLELGLELRRKLPNLGIVLLSNHYEPYLLATLPEDEFQGWSYLLKRSVANVDTLVRAIHGSASGLVVVDREITRARVSSKGESKYGLTARQLEVLALMAEGYSNAGIASRLYLSEKSVENHVSRIFQQLGITTDREQHGRVIAVLRYLEIMAPDFRD